MNETLLGLTVAYVIFTALLLLALIHSRLHVTFKGALLLLAVGFYWLGYQGWRESQGWPSNTRLPNKFLFHFAVIEEPDEERGFAGNIFIWLSDLKGQALAAEPRAYRIDYEQKIHGRLEDALRRMRNGKLQLGFIESESARERAGYHKKQESRSQQVIAFIDLPDPALPEK